MHTTDSVRVLSDDELLAQLHMLLDESSRREDEKFVPLVRAHLASAEVAGEIAEAGGTPIKVVWSTWDWDNGWFFDPNSGVVKLDNGKTVEVGALNDVDGFSELLDEQSSLAQPLGDKAELILDLRDGGVESNTYGDKS